MSERGTLLVLGAREASLGAAVKTVAEGAGFSVVTAGIHDEDHTVDVLTCSMTKLADLMEATQPHHLICTVGINMPEPVLADDLFDWYRWHFETNVIGPMRLLQAFGEWAYQHKEGREEVRHFVAVSSNSATIPRSRSAAYCASKAALSMALRVKAREVAGGDSGHIVYGYEPGLLAGTPMTQKTEADFPGMALHRMRGSRLTAGVPTEALAVQMVAGLIVPGAALNGTLLRYDGGEL